MDEVGYTITLELPGDVAERAQEVARQTHRQLEDILLEWLQQAAEEEPFESLPDERILAISAMTLNATQQAELSDLLAKQREGELDQQGYERLDALMLIYRKGLTRKAEAMKVAVERGLLPPLN